MSVCSSEAFIGKRDFHTVPLQDKCHKLLVQIPLTNKHLFYNYVVRLSVSNSFNNYGFIRPCFFAPRIMF